MINIIIPFQEFQIIIVSFIINWIISSLKVLLKGGVEKIYMTE